MSLSAQGLQWLKDIEKLALQPYDDQTGRRITSWCEGATIGFGHLISTGEWNHFKFGISREEADDLLQADLAPFERAVRSTNRNFSSHQYDAAVVFAFNIGLNAFLTSTAFKMLKNPDYHSSTYRNLEEAWKAYNKSQKKLNKGLVNRRSAEWDMFSKGIYRHW